MKNIQLLNLDQYKDFNHYQLVEEGIHIDLGDTDATNYRIAISYAIESGEDSQYPLENLLDEFCLYVSDFLESENQNQDQVKLEFAGTFEDIQKVKTILGKRVYSRVLFRDVEDTYYDFVIEEEIMNENQRYIFEIISQKVKAGLLSQEEIKNNIQDIILDEELEEIPSQWINSVINSEFKKLTEESKYWSHPTDNEKLEVVFDKLWNEHKIIALHHAGYTIGEGEEQVIEQEIYLRSEGLYSEGYCFYHGQHVERVIGTDCNSLFLIFQKIDNEDDRVTQQIGQLIKNKLQEEGFKVHWDGNPLVTIEILDFNWQKRYIDSLNAIAPQFRKLSEIQHLLPADSWVKEYVFDRGGEDEICLFIAGDWELENLDLDEVKDEQGNYISLILVAGNMKVKNIYCENTDGATGLIVTGSLEAENMIVGGQEIYICGDLRVKDCFWGDYNHGELVVIGTITMQVFIATDYGFDFDLHKKEDRLKLDVFLWDEEEQEGFPQFKIRNLFREDCIAEELDLDEEDDLYSWNDWLNRSQIIEHLKAGKPILLQNIINVQDEAPEVEIPFVFESRAFNNANLLRLRESPLFLDNFPTDGTERHQTIEYWRGDDFKRVVVTKEELFSEKVYFQQGDRALLMQYEEVKRNVFQTLLGETPQYQITLLCRTITEGVSDNWFHYNSLLKEHKKYSVLTQDFWENLLTEWSEMEYYHQQFQKVITTEKINHILSLPVVKEKYSDYYDDDKEALWFRNFNWQFRQIDNIKKVCQRITIACDISTEEEKIYDFYHFDIEKLENGVIAPVLYTQYDDGYGASVFKVAICNIDKFKNAIRYFEMMETKIEKINSDYLEELEAKEKSRQKNIAETPHTVPFETLKFDGHQFKVINVHQANELLKDIKDLEEKEYLYDVFNYDNFFKHDKDAVFLLAEDDVVLTKLELCSWFEREERYIQIRGIIFLKNLTVSSHINSSAAEMNYAPALIIMGNLNCRNIYLFGNVHYIAGNVAGEFLYAEYNQGTLYVKGRLMVDCVVSRDMPCYFGEIVAKAIVSEYSIYGLDSILDAQNMIKKILNFYPNTHFLEDVLIPEVMGGNLWGERWPDNLEDWISEGKSVIDRTKNLEYKTVTDATIAPRFEAIFNHALLADGSYSIESAENKYTFTCFEWNGKQYRDIGYKNTGNFRHQLRILHAVEANAYTAELEYLDKATDKATLRFSSTLADTFTSTKAVKHAFCMAERVLMSQSRLSNANMDNANGLTDASNLFIETVIGITLPLEYKTWLKNYSGEECIPIEFVTQDGKITSRVKSFFLPEAAKENNLLSKMIEFNKSAIIPANLIPIAIDPINCLILIAISGDDVGKIYYWAKDEEDFEDTCTYINLHLVSEGFNDFMGLKKAKVLEIDLTDEGLTINATPFTFPIAVNELRLILGEAEFFKKDKQKDSNDIYTWHEAGIFGYSKKDQLITTVAIHVSEHYNFKFGSHQLFTQVFKINGEPYEQIQFEKEKKGYYVEKRIGNNSLFIGFNGDQVTQINISEFQELQEPEPLEDPDRYDFKPITGEKIEFADFNFKLAVVQVLMYEKELLLPKFDIYEFTKRYTARVIDLEEEGYDLIPEVTAYFEKLEIDKKFAEEITEIYQLGSDIYLNMINFWDGEDEVFNINTFTDVEQFPNLKSMTLFYDIELKELEYLKSRGITVEDV